MFGKFILNPDCPLKGHSHSVCSVAWSPSGVLASGSDDKSIILWQGDKRLCTLTGHSDSVYSVAWSPDGKILASGSEDKTIKLWDSATKQNICTLRGHNGENGCLCYQAPDYDINPNCPLSGHYSSVFSVAWSVDGILASGSADKSVKLWKDGHCTCTLRGHDLKDGCLCKSNGFIGPDCPLTGHKGRVSCVAWGQGDILASGSYDENDVIVWSQAGSRLCTLKGHSHSVCSVAWSPSGVLASGSYDNSIILWQGDKRLCTLTGHTHHVMSVAWSREGLLASGSADKSIKLWDGDKLKCTMSGHFGWVSSVAFGSNGMLASGSSDRSVKLWKNDELLCTLTGHEDIVMSVAFGPTWFAIVMQQEISISQSRAAKYQSRFALLPDNCHSRILTFLGSALASTSRTLRIWHV
jgi:WD40 repeat protein